MYSIYISIIIYNIQVFQQKNKNMSKKMKQSTEKSDFNSELDISKLVKESFEFF